MRIVVQQNPYTDNLKVKTPGAAPAAPFLIPPRLQAFPADTAPPYHMFSFFSFFLPSGSVISYTPVTEAIKSQKKQKRKAQSEKQ